MREPAFQFPGNVCGRAREERIDSAAICINGGGGGKRAFISALDREKKEGNRSEGRHDRESWFYFIYLFLFIFSNLAASWPGEGRGDGGESSVGHLRSSRLRLWQFVNRKPKHPKGRLLHSLNSHPVRDVDGRSL